MHVAFLWLLQALTLEDFSHLPPEQRRKRLQQRIDELGKELQKEMDQRYQYRVLESGGTYAVNWRYSFGAVKIRSPNIGITMYAFHNVWVSFSQ